MSLAQFSPSLFIQYSLSTNLDLRIDTSTHVGTEQNIYSGPDIGASNYELWKCLIQDSWSSSYIFFLQLQVLFCQAQPQAPAKAQMGAEISFSID